jgi:hypothetical protein
VRFLVLLLFLSVFGWSGAVPAAAAALPGTAAALPGTAAAAPEPPGRTAPPGRADVLAERLARDPVQITDHALREVRPGDAARFKAVLSRLGVPVYLVVEPDSLPRIEDSARNLIPLLHDRLGKDGIYIVTDPSGYGAARQFGGSLPADRAWTVASLELPYRAGVLEHVERFVEILTSPNPAQRISERRPKPEEPPTQGEIRDRKEMAAMGAGTALGGVPLLAFLLVRWVRRERGRR